MILVSSQGGVIQKTLIFLEIKKELCDVNCLNYFRTFHLWQIPVKLTLIFSFETGCVIPL